MFKKSEQKKMKKPKIIIVPHKISYFPQQIFYVFLKGSAEI